MLSQSTKMAELEARVAKLEKENKTLDNIKNDLSEANSELKRNNVLLTNTCSDLAQQVDKTTSWRKEPKIILAFWRNSEMPQRKMRKLSQSRKK